MRSKGFAFNVALRYELVGIAPEPGSEFSQLSVELEALRQPVPDFHVYIASAREPADCVLLAFLALLPLLRAWTTPGQVS